MARWLERASSALALAGGLVLLAVALLAVVSILGRWLADAPIAGDIELMQVACAVSIALFLPYCQLHAGHVTVDFFTLRASAGTRRALDRVGHAAAALAMLLLAWRAGVGVADMKVVGETTMVLGVPTWLTYLAMVPGLLVSSLVALHAVFVPGAAEERVAGP
jgi:TRAP-type C4-dicarboxylate transport system permease small subunit